MVFEKNEIQVNHIMLYSLLALKSIVAIKTQIFENSPYLHFSKKLKKKNLHKL